jgi:Putative zinc-binding metallo-peptidase
MSERASHRAGRKTRININEASDEVLLAMRLRDLPVHLTNTFLARRIARLHQELAARRIVALPHVWLAEEFFAPEGVLGFAVPFYLAHPRLMRLERAQMLDCEGAGEAECRRILRHEAGHAIDEAYRLHRRPRYRQLFGNSRKPYPSAYRPRVDSRDYVVNLAGWYAQAHPAEDFAETFAVWLNPYLDWRTSYKDWPAIEKLEYVDKVMKRIAGVPPPVSDKAEVDPLGSLRRTLNAHYTAKRARFAWKGSPNYDQDLRRIFSDAPKDPGALTAARYLRRMRGALRARIVEGTGVHAYAVDQLLRQTIARVENLALCVVDPPDVVMERLLVFLTMQTAGVVHAGFPKVAL